MADHNNEYNGFSEYNKVRRVSDMDERYTYRERSSASSQRGYPQNGNRTSGRDPYSSSTGGTRSRSSSYDPYRNSANSSTRSKQPVRSSSAAGHRTQAGNKNYKRRKRRSNFKKKLLIYVAVLIVILIIFSIVFSSLCASIEQGQAYNVASSIVEKYSSQKGIVEFINDNSDQMTLIESVDRIAETYATNIAGKAISYLEDFNNSTDEEKSYYILADGEKVAYVTLVPDGSGSFGQQRWKVGSLNITDYLPDSLTMEITAPADATVTVNDTVLDETYVTSSGIPELLANSTQFISDPPQTVTYKLSGFTSTPAIIARDASGNSLKVQQDESSALIGYAADDEFIASVEDRVYAAISEWGTYFIAMSFNLYNYVKYGSDLYGYIFGSDTMDPIYTSFYNYEEIAGYDFTEKTASNYVKYSDDCFTVDVKYDLDVYFTVDSYEDNNQNLDATWVFVIEDDGSWCISDCIYH